MAGVTNLRLEICFMGGFDPRDPALAGKTRRVLNDVQCNKINIDIFLTREDKGDREGIPHTHPIP